MLFDICPVHTVTFAISAFCIQKKLMPGKVSSEPEMDITSKSIMDDSRLGKPVSWTAMLNCLFPRVVCNFY